MRIFFSAGEPSGDQHAAHLIHELNQRTEFTAEGFGGPEMLREGCQLLYPTTELAVMGFLRVIPHIAHFRRLVKQAEQHFQTDPPDAVVLVDFPGFNWWIARAAKRNGIPVFYYLPPQLWAWAPWRIRRVRKWVDHVICTLPFEYDWYVKKGVKATWVGHPFFDAVADQSLDLETMERLCPSVQDERVFALLPGSRGHEIDRNWSVILQVAASVQKALPETRWIVGSYSAEHREQCEVMQREEAPELNIQYETGRTSEVVEAADACLMVSGSISLELLARRTPGVVVYRCPRVGRFIARFLLNCRFITLTNLIADEEVMPEFISVGNPRRDIYRMSEILIDWGRLPDALAEQRGKMAAIAETAAITGATVRTADLLLKEIARTAADKVAA